jgi:hypothetical protein
MSPSEASPDLDPRAPIVDRDTLKLVAELEVRQAMRLQYFVSLLVLQADTEEPRPHAEWVAPHRLIAEAIRDQIRRSDVVSVTPGSPYLQVLLVSSFLDSLPGIIGRIVVALDGRIIDPNGGAAPLTLSMGGACYPTTARDRVELFQQAESLSVEAREDRSRSGHRFRLAQRAS